MDWYANTSQVMSRSAIQFQNGLYLIEYYRLFGSGEQCEAALEKA
jgi:hypothetical protein